MHRFITGVGFSFVAAVLLSGCGKGELPRSTVHGSIKYQGKPVSETTLIFVASDNMTYRAELDAEGKYRIEGVPQGLIKVSLQQATPRMPVRPTPTVSKGKGDFPGEKKDVLLPPPPSTAPELKFVLPKSYTMPDQSGLSFELKEPNQDWSVDLK